MCGGEIDEEGRIKFYLFRLDRWAVGGARDDNQATKHTVEDSLQTC